MMAELVLPTQSKRYIMREAYLMDQENIGSLNLLIFYQMDYEEENKSPKRKKNKKQIQILANTMLGFQKPEIEEEEYIPRRRVVKNISEFDQQLRKFNFRAKFKFVVEASVVPRQQLALFTGMNPDQWKKIFQVMITISSNHPVICPICLNDQDQMVAPVITTCGHIYCWPCVLMHFKRSKKTNSCPVCNEYIHRDELKYCKIICKNPIELNSEILFVLRVKEANKNIIYDPVTLEEDFNFSRMLQVQKEYLIQNIQKYSLALQNYLKQYRSQGSQQQVPFIQQSIQYNHRKLLSALNVDIDKLVKKKSYVPNIRNNIHYNKLRDKDSLIYFYQQQYGRLIFLHPICNSFIQQQFQSNQDLPLQLISKVVYKENLKLDEKAMKRYKHLNHISLNNEIIFVEIDMTKYLLFNNMINQFHRDMTKHKDKILAKETEQNRRNEELINRRMAKKLLKEKQTKTYQPWPVDDEIKDLKTCNRQLNFPSLIQQQPKVQVQQETKIQQPTPVITKTVQKLIEVEEFPDLGTVKKQESKMSQRFGKKKRKNKGEAVDITSLLFQRAQQQ